MSLRDLPSSSAEAARPLTPSRAVMDDVRWDDARSTASAALSRGPETVLPARSALGRVLARPLLALQDQPAADTSAMDGWAVCGTGPWSVRESLRAGELGAGLRAGEAAAVATGSWLPAGTTAVLRQERGRLTGGILAARDATPSPGADVRPRGQEARLGDVLLPAGRLVTPAVLALACADGNDELAVVERPRVALLVMGDELLTSGPARDGRVRDALGPSLPAWLSACGAEVISTRRLADDPRALLDALSGARGEIVLTTGGTAAGPVDHVHDVLGTLGAQLLVDGVAVRPGHPMLLARLPDGRLHVGLPGNPLAAVAGILTLVDPLLRGATGRGPAGRQLVLEVPLRGHPRDVRLVPLADGRPTDHDGPAMLRGLASADAVAVVAPGGCAAGEPLTVLPLPWHG